MNVGDKVRIAKHMHEADDEYYEVGAVGEIISTTIYHDYYRGDMVMILFTSGRVHEDSDRWWAPVSDLELIA